MKIWHLTRTLSGGAGLYALRVSQALNEHGLNSTVLLAEGAIPEGTRALTRLISPRRRLTTRAFRSVSHRIALGPFHSLNGPEIYESVEPIKSGDIVHLHGMTAWIGLRGLRRLIPKGARVFWTGHDLWMLSGGCVVYGGCHRFSSDCSDCPILRSPWKGLARYELNSKQSFMAEYQIRPIANSRWMADRIGESRLFAKSGPVSIIPPIVDAAYFKPDLADLRGSLRIDARRIVLCLGARSLDDKFKGIPAFLAELARTPALAGQVTALLFGPGKIEVPTNLDVRFLGSVPNPAELAKVYRTGDVFVSPSAMETFGMTLVEAQSCGTPVVAFDVGGIRDAVHPEFEGWLEPTSRMDNLVGRLKRFLQGHPMDQGKKKSLRDWAEHSFSAARVAKAQRAVYER